MIRARDIPAEFRRGSQLNAPRSFRHRPWIDRGTRCTRQEDARKLMRRLQLSYPHVEYRLAYFASEEKWGIENRRRETR